MASKAAYIGAGLLKGFARGGEYLAKRSLEQEEREAEDLRRRSLAEFEAELTDTYAQKRENRAYERDKDMVDYRNEAKKGQVNRTITRMDENTGKQYKIEIDSYGNPVTKERFSGMSEGLLSGGSGSGKQVKLGDVPEDVLNDPLLQRVVKDEDGNPIPDMKTGRPVTETNWSEVSQIRDMMTQYGIKDWRQGVLLYKQSVLPQRIEQERQQRIQAVIEAGPEKARELIEKMKPETRAQLVSELPDDFLSQVESSANKPSVNTDSRDPKERYANATPEQIAESLRGKAPFLIDNHLRQLPQEKAEQVRKKLNSKKAADPYSLKGSLENAGRKLGLLE